jgi:hypothetical protein
MELKSHHTQSDKEPSPAITVLNNSKFADMTLDVAPESLLGEGEIPK